MTRSRGFTLVELVMVILLAAIIAYAAFARLPSKGALTIAAQAEQLAADVRYAQMLSQTRGERFCLNLAANSYQLTTAASGCATGAPHSAGYTGSIALDGITLSWTNLPANYVVFGDVGVPYIDAVTPGTALAANAVITLSGDGGPKTVTISPVTGRVRVQ
jgi:MSHA pilin protein MshC